MFSLVRAILVQFVLTGHSSLEKVLMQASSLASQTETRASAEPVAKYLPHLVHGLDRSMV